MHAGDAESHGLLCVAEPHANPKTEVGPAGSTETYSLRMLRPQSYGKAGNRKARRHDPRDTPLHALVHQ